MSEVQEQNVVHAEAAGAKKPDAVLQATATPFWMVLLIAALFSIASSFVTWEIITSRPITPVVMMDAKKLAMANLEMILARAPTDASDAGKDAEVFLGKMNQQLQALSDSGILVINSSVVINKPDGFDITPQVAEALGIDFNKTEELRQHRLTLEKREESGVQGAK